MYQKALLAATLAVVLLSCQTAAAPDWQWRTGRATNYGGSGDPWTIHHGSCRYDYLDPTVNKGWDVAALPDAVSDYQGSCGRCYEIGCAPMHLKDGYGTGLDRANVCYDTSQTVVVMITDSCPCNYPPNQYSNKRWCCGDYYHFDMSTWAFEKLAARKWGVIGVRYREVPCSHCPDNPALLPPGASPEPAVQGAPSGWQPSWDKRPSAKNCFKSSLERQDSNTKDDSKADSSQGSNAGDGSRNNDGGSTSASSGASASSSASSYSSASSSASSYASASSSASSYASASSSTSGGNLKFPSDSLLSGWQDMSTKLSPWSATTPDGQSAYCGTMEGYASLQFKGSTGSLMGKRKLIINVKTEGGNIPDFSLSLSSSKKGTCRTLDLRSISGATRNGDWAEISVPLVNLAWWKSTWSWNEDPFSGCGGAIGAWDVDTIWFKNKWGGRQALCLANVKAY